MASLAVRLGSLELRNPVLSASGTFGHGLEMREFTPPESVGGLVSKTVTLRPRPGNPAPRICETEAGLLNSIGLENRGVDAYLADVVPSLAGADTCIVTNIGGEETSEFARMAERLDRVEAIDAFEVNLSCPNVQGGRLPFATDPDAARRVIELVRGATGKPVFAKLSPNVSNIAEMAVVVEAAGADAITAVNTLLGMAVDWRTGRPGLATVQGGYSGVGIKPVALRCAWACARSVDIPIIGCGGARTASDVLEFLSVGCTAVQVGTACFSDPSLLGRLPGEIAAELDAAGIPTVTDVIGSVGATEAESRTPGAPS